MATRSTAAAVVPQYGASRGGVVAVRPPWTRCVSVDEGSVPGTGMSCPLPACAVRPPSTRPGSRRHAEDATPTRQDERMTESEADLLPLLRELDDPGWLERPQHYDRGEAAMHFGVL